MNRSVISRMQVVLLIDIIIVATAAGGYFYIASLPPAPLGSAQIQLTELTLSQTQALEGQTIDAVVNVTNIGTETGFYTPEPTVDGVPVSGQLATLKLASGETQVVEFEIPNVSEGTHLVKIGNLEATFTVTNIFALSNLAINRTEAKVGEPVGISVTVTNRAEEAAEYSLTLTVNGATVETKKGQLEASSSTSVLFEVVEQTEGTYAVKIGELTGTFTVTAAAPPPKPAEFQVSNLLIDPGVTQPNSPVVISVNVTNVGESSGTYNLELKINDNVQGTKSVQLSGGATTLAEFTVTEPAKGTYAVTVGGLSGEFSVQEPSKIRLANMFVKPYEVWVDQTVNVVVTATNPDPTDSTVSIKVLVDKEVADTKTVTVPGGASLNVEFTVTAKSEGTHSIAVNDLTGGGFKVVKTGYHTLSVSSSPVTGADFTLDGVPHKTFYSELLPEGTYTITVPATDPTGRYTFQSWDDGSTSPTITVNLVKQTTVTASFTGGSSCPSLYMWNGTQYVHVGDVSNHGWLGYTRYVNSDGSLEYWRNNPWDYIPLNKSQLQTENGYFQMNLTQRWDEIFFIDSAYMLAVDHPADTNVYSTMVEQYIDPAYMGQIYSVSKNPLTPVSAINEIATFYNGEVVAESGQTDALAQIASPDGVFTSGYNGKYSEAWNNQTWNRLTLNLGNLTGAPQIKLIIKAKVDWGPEESYMLWMNKFYSTQVPDHTEPTPTPFMEVIGENGIWVRVPENRQFPLPPDGIARTYVVDLTGLFSTDDYSIRISNFWNVTFDYIGVDITPPQQNLTVHRINAQGDLYQQFIPTTVLSSGNFTRYGNVTDLLLQEDDMFVVGRRGDSVFLQFPADSLPPVSEGMERDYFLFVAAWFKVQYANYGFGPGNDGFTVTPLPFRNMSGFPYSLKTESYPYDAAHLAYLREYNTRVIEAQP